MPGKCKHRRHTRMRRWFGGHRRPDSPTRSCSTLLNVLPGQVAWLAGFSSAMSRQQAAHLQAYGMMPGRRVRVIQQSPVTIVQIDHLELALEHELADAIQVGQVSTD